jgi:hypothetical protein
METYLLMTTVPNIGTNAVNQVRKFNNIPAKNVVLPGLLIGNMAYKLGTEKNPQKRGDLLTNSLVSWLGGFLLYNANNKVLPYFTLPIVAGSIALYKIAQQDTPEEKTDTAVNHGAWWASGIAAQQLARLAKLKGPFNSLVAFAVGASVVGPVVASFVKQKIIPTLAKSNDIGKTFDTLKMNEYSVGKRNNANFSPFNDPSPSSFNGKGEPVNTNLDQTAYNPFDPYNLKGSIPGGLV